MHQAQASEFPRINPAEGLARGSHAGLCPPEPVLILRSLSANSGVHVAAGCGWLALCAWPVRGARVRGHTGVLYSGYVEELGCKRNLVGLSHHSFQRWTGDWWPCVCLGLALGHPGAAKQPVGGQPPPCRAAGGGGGALAQPAALWALARQGPVPSGPGGAGGGHLQTEARLGPGRGNGGRAGGGERPEPGWAGRVHVCTCAYVPGPWRGGGEGERGTWWWGEG